jgi:uncharacterized protein YbjQ (UPF0145 family)
MSLGKIPVGKIIVRTVETVLIAWVIKDAFGLYDAGKKDAAIGDVILSVAIVVAVETILWLIVLRSQKRWSISAEEVFVRGIQVIVVVAMIADVTSSLFTGEGLGVHQPGFLLSVAILEGIIRRFIRPDPRPSVMAHALTGIRKKVKVFTHLPSEKVKETLGLVRGISDIEASSRLDFELAEQEALYLMLKQARELGANAVVDARLTTGTYETNGSQWQVSRPVYTGTAVRI